MTIRKQYIIESIKNMQKLKMKLEVEKNNGRKKNTPKVPSAI